MLKDLIVKNRSYRRFDRSDPVSMETLRELVDLARLSPSAGNHQALKFFLSADAAQNAAIFPLLRWAVYLKDWDGPDEDERPTAYIVILHDKERGGTRPADEGIAAQSILLGATEKGYGGCIFASADTAKLAAALELPERYEILLVIALGKPGEKVVLETVKPDGNIRYWRDAESTHHVPKRPLDDIIVTG
ncbi:MAG: nitroreductase family protein [Chloroflexota bacterium]